MQKKILVFLIAALCLAGCAAAGNTKTPAGTSAEETVKQDEPDSLSTQENTTAKTDGGSQNASHKEVETYLDKYFLLNTSYDGAIKIFGNYEEQVLYIMDGDEVISLELEWLSPRQVLPEITRMDVNADGQDEYLITAIWGTGSGVHINQLYIVEKSQDGWELRAWDYDTVLSALNDRIRYKYADDYQTMELFDRDKLIGTVFMGNRLKEANEKFENISYGDLLTIELIHGKPWLTFSIGLLLSNRVMPDYDIPMNITAPLLFENGQVIIGNMTMQSFYTPSGEEEWIAQETWKEIYTCYCDVTQDGVLDKIVISGTVFDEYPDPIDSIKAYGVGKLDIYEGYSAENTEHPTNGSYSEACIYTTTFSTSHAGNMQLSVVEKDGSTYLVETGLYCGMGQYAYSYRVFFPKWKQLFVVEENAVSFQDELGDTSEFFNSLYRWFEEEATLLFAADIDYEGELLISTEADILRPEVYYDLKK